MIGQDGTIRLVHDDMNPNQHVKRTLEAVQALKVAKKAPRKPAT